MFMWVLGWCLCGLFSPWLDSLLRHDEQAFFANKAQRLRVSATGLSANAN